MLAWCGEHGFDLCLIETMPMGEISEDRTDQYLPLSIVRGRLRRRWTLEETDYRTGGPARYFNVKETGRRVGFITPMTHNFCESCNRVRLTCTGTLYMCLGQDDQADLRAVLRSGASDAELEDAIREAISRKPKGHDFIIDRRHDTPGGGAAYERDGRVGQEEGQGSAWPSSLIFPIAVAKLARRPAAERPLVIRTTCVPLVGSFCRSRNTGGCSTWCTPCSTTGRSSPANCTRPFSRSTSAPRNDSSDSSQSCNAGQAIG